MAKEAPTRIYGVVGFPVEHSLSPEMHNAAFEHCFKNGSLNFKAIYERFKVEPEGLENSLSLDNLKNKNIWGLNITIPHKIRAREILEKKFPFDHTQSKQLETEYYVKLSGAINTIKREDDRLYYYNTDASGFLRSLEMDLNFKTKNKKVLLIGCGGAGRAIIAALSWTNKDTIVNKIYVNDINEQATTSAKEHFSKLPQWSGHLEKILEFISAKALPDHIQNCDLLVNATPIGMKGEDIPVVNKKLLQLNKELYVYDVVYNRDKETYLIADAKSLGLHTENGLSMLLYQGVDAFELWTGQKAPVEIMREALNIRS